MFCDYFLSLLKKVLVLNIILYYLDSSQDEPIINKNIDANLTNTEKNWARQKEQSSKIIKPK